MKVVYLAGPYSHKTAAGVHDNIEKARLIAQELWTIYDLCCICPHGNTLYMHLVDRSDQESYEKFMEGDFELIRRSDGVVLMPNWDISRGAIREKEYASELGRPIFKWPDDKRAIVDWARSFRPKFTV